MNISKNTGMCLTALFVAGAFSASAQVDLKAVGNDHISISINGQPFSDFYIGPNYAKPFLAPLRTATGLIVSRRWPMETVDGESRDHPHHKGLFVGYGDVSDVNFWEVESASKPSQGNPTTKGTVTLARLDEVAPGNKHGSITATFVWRAPGHGDMLEEKRMMTFYADAVNRVIDVDLTFTAKQNVRFGDTKEGFFAVRLADPLIEKNGGVMTNADGAQTEKNVWGKRADWVDYDGTLEGQKLGIVIFDNPQNLNHPPRWHSRAYGLFAVNPFGVKDFEPQSSDKAGYALNAGNSLRLRYRLIIHPGDVPKKKIADWYSDYTKKSK